MASKSDARCLGCPLFKLGSGFARTDGLGNLGVLVVAEALGEEEAKEGRPLVGKAGRVWDRIVRRTKDSELGRSLERNDFIHGNCINCRPPENHLVGAPYEFGALDHCRPYLLDTLRNVKPKAIITLGNTPLRWFTGQWGIEKLRGYIFDTEWGPLVPTYHPSYIMRGKWNLARVVEADILKAVQVARHGREFFDAKKHYIPRPTIDEAYLFYERWVSAGRPTLAFDIETPYGSLEKDAEMTFEEDESYTILMCSFSFEPFHAVSFPWVPPFIDVIKALLAEAPEALVYNAKFDVPRLMANGVDFGGEIIDGMLAWHWLEPSLPMGLKFIATFFTPDMGAWALEKDKDFQLYNCGDSDVLFRSYLEIKKRLIAQDRWGVFERHFLEFGKILTKMTKRGIQVDRETRTKSRLEFEEELTKVIEKVQGMAPVEVCPKKIYKSSEATLRKKGLFSSGRMVEIPVEISEEEYAKRQAAALPKAPKQPRPKKLPVLQGDVASVPDGNDKPRRKRRSSKQTPIPFGE